GPSRSKAIFQLGTIHSHGLLTSDELERFTPETRERLYVLSPERGRSRAGRNASRKGRWSALRSSQAQSRDGTAGAGVVAADPAAASARYLEWAVDPSRDGVVSRSVLMPATGSEFAGTSLQAQLALTDRRRRSSYKTVGVGPEISKETDD